MVERVSGQAFKKTGPRLDRILEGAINEFAKQGYSASSLESIASAADILKGSLYHYITDKADLLFYLLAKMTEDVLEICETVDQENVLCADRLRAFTFFHSTYAARNAKLLSIYYRSWPQLNGGRKEAVRAQRDEISAWMLKNVREQFATSGSPGGIGAEMAMYFYFGASNWIHTWYVPGVSPEPEVVGKHCSQNWLRSIGIE